ncbi:hypothetical protein [Subtercola sp. RTI3]|uniref:hypothetical protein n=1 Tax=Subtercola sp. RTI3 TaxID=3048639 RepID=UPI002B23E394|nr:hypothetical protein [Subtercola sp. RTI3]MEA9985154.1 hypothetical protein [Subtercola sp. RTI3]
MTDLPDVWPTTGWPTTAWPPAAVRTAMGGDLPRMVLKNSALVHNVDLMSRFCAEAGVELAPHAKTHLSEELCRRQLAAGAWAMTAATTAQVRQLVTFGVPRILHANVLVDSAAIEFVAETFLAEHPVAEYLCYIDSVEGAELLERELGRLQPARRLRVLLEVGFTGGRTGTRSAADALALGRRVAKSGLLELAGVAGFEGLIPLAGGAFPPGARELLVAMRELVVTLHDEGLFMCIPIVTAGGSSYFDLVVTELGPGAVDFETICVLRSGCYITHDHGVYERTSPFGLARDDNPATRFEPAFELWASVLSEPEPGLVIVGFGRREAPTDDRLPVLLGVLDALSPDATTETTTATTTDTTSWVITGVNDHHAFLRVPTETRLSPGTVLRFGISHPCGAFDRWRTIALLDDDGCTIGAITPAL